jgi:PAS domain S-box-containing protein
MHTRGVEGPFRTGRKAAADRKRSPFDNPLVRYSFAAAAAGAAFLLREGLFLFVDPNFPDYLTFYPTVLLVALLAGLWPAILSTLGAALLAAAWILAPRGNFLAALSANFIGLVLFVAVCVFISATAELYRRNRSKAAAYDKEQALRESQQALRQQAELLRLSFDAIIVWRAAGGIESWNRGAVDLFGYAEGEALGRSPHELLGAARRVPWAEIQEVLRAQGRWEGELDYRTRDGREVTVSCRLQIERGSDGRERILEIDRDITDRRRVQVELQRAHDRLEEKVEQRTEELLRANRMLRMISMCDQALVQISDERELMYVICQIIQDEGGYPLVWVGLAENDEARSVVRAASAGDTEGFLDTIRVTWDESPFGMGPTGSAIRSGSAAIVSDISTLPDPIPWKEVALSRGFRSIAAFPLLTAEKAAFGALVIYADRDAAFEEGRVTLLRELVDDLTFGIVSLRARVERDQAQRALETKASELRILAAELVRAEERERKRIARLLHDQLQQLLAAALYGLVSIRPASQDPEFRETVGKLEGMLRECLAMSRSLTSELSHPAFSEPDLRSALGWLASTARERYGLEATVEAAETAVVEAEEIRITILQAVRELLFNVVKHAGVKKAAITLDVDGEGRVRVSVRDEGVGFDLSRVSPLGGPSAGIGLFGIRERLAMAGGGMEIESAPGRGSRLTVWVPSGRPAGEAAPPAAAAPASPALPRPRPPGGRRPVAAGRRIRVLLVDDHMVVRDGLALQLRQQPDLEIVGQAADGEAAVELVRRLRPDVVTMDVSMPGMGGVEAVRAIHREFPDTRIIGLSMFDEPAQAAAMRDAGAAGYLSKSESSEQLLEAIRSCARRPRGRRAARP